MAKSNNQISSSLSSIRGIKRESEGLIKITEKLERKIKDGKVMPDGITVVKLSSKHGSIIKHRKQIAAEIIRLERKK